MAVLKADELAEKLRECHGNMAACGRAFGVTRNAVWKYIQSRPSLLEVARECRETMIDHAESALYRAVLAGEAWAVCFILKTQAKNRGYVEKAIIAGDPAALLAHTLVRKEYEVTRNGASGGAA